MRQPELDPGPAAAGDQINPVQRGVLDPDQHFSRARPRLRQLAVFQDVVRAGLVVASSGLLLHSFFSLAGALAGRTSDIGAMELYAASVITGDPLQLARLLKDTLGA